MGKMGALTVLLCLLLTAKGFQTTTRWPWTTDFQSCMNNCGYHLGSCSCDNSCQYYGNCCPDYNNYCLITTDWLFTTTVDIATTDELTTASTEWPWYTESAVLDPSAAPCGGYMTDRMGEFFSPQYPHNYPNNAQCSWTIHSTGTLTVLLTFTYIDLESCCDYIRVFDGSSTLGPLLGELQENRIYSFNSTRNDLTVIFYSDSSVTQSGFRAEWVFTSSESCRNNCGNNFSNCSCSSSCQYYGNCCHDYNSYCPASTDWPGMTTASHSCWYNCGNDLGSCSCSSSCQYYGNCCHDFYWYCPISTTTDYHPECGGHLYGSGLFSTANYPSYYHDNAYCVWYLSAQQGQRIFLSFTDVQLERCCNCDYISIHDGSSTSSPLLGQVCFNDTTHQAFHSSSRYLTVLFRSDYSGVSHGFKALFTSSLTADQGRVDCSSDNMVIVIQTSYLNSLGFNGNDLYVDDHVCRPTITSTDVVFHFPLDTCGTGKVMMNGYVTYTNNVRASQSQSGEITRQSQFLLHVGCRMEPDTMVEIFYKAKENINANITGTGRFNASIAFYTSSSFSQQIYDSPYEVSLNQYMYAMVKLDRHDDTLDIFLDTCVASPYANDFQTRSYDLLRDGCAKDTYYSYTNGQHYYAQFRFQAFKFLRTHAYVYLQCKVIICPDNDYNSRCHQGCRKRRRRSLDTTYHTNTVILGPIKLKEGTPALKQPENIETAE